MRNELKHIEEIENYLTGNMNEQETASFEVKMKLDGEFAKDVVLQKQLMERISLNAFKNELMVAHISLSGQGKSGWWNRRYYLNSILIALLFSVAGIASYYSIFSEDKKQTALHERKNQNQLKYKTQGNSTAQQETASMGQEIPSEETRSAESFQAESFRKDQEKPGEFSNPFLLAFHKQVIDAGKDEIFEMRDSKSLVYIPAFSLEDQDGKSVSGKVEIRYREYRNAAQIAFSGIPMTFSEDGQEYKFNSAGMFEIRAFQNGKELRMKNTSSFLVNYNAVEQLEDCFFFALDEKAKKWDKKCRIKFLKGKGGEGGLLWRKPQKDDTVREAENLDFGLLAGRIRDAVNGQNLYNVKISFSTKRNKRETTFATATHDSTYSFRIDQGLTALITGRKNRTAQSKANPVGGTFNLRLSCSGYKTMFVEDVLIVKGHETELNIKMLPRTARKKTGFISFFRKQTVDPNANFRSSYQLQNMVRPVAATENNIAATEENIAESGQNEVKVQAQVVNGALPERKIELAGEDSIVKQNNEIAGDCVETIFINGRSGTMLAGADVGHTYPNLIKGLNCPQFGVYNCDQIYQLGDQLAIEATYLDEEGKKIPNSYLLSLVDLKFNGAFSFNPSRFNCSKSGRNVLLLFTDDKRLFALREEDYKNMNVNGSGAYSFVMKEITEKVKNTEDLKLFLGLK